MLQAINDKAKGILGWVIIGLICITFALFGIADYLGNDSAAFAAKVDDTEISYRSYQEAVSRQRQRLESMFNGKLPSDAAFESRVKDQVLEQLITRALIENRVNEKGYRTTDSIASNKIKEIESFQEDGAFSSSMYKRMINSQGMSLAQFEDVFRSDLLVMQLQDAIIQTSIVGNGAIQQINKIQQQSRDISYLEINMNQFVADIVINDAEVQQHYEKNKMLYMHPEKVDVSYIEIKSDDLSSNVEIEEQAIREAYDDYLAHAAGNEQRQAKHILIQFDAMADSAVISKARNKIDGVVAELKSGTPFNELAIKHSNDPGSAAKGGNLGWISKGMMGDAFDEALFELNKNEVSDVVQSEFGYHVIQLTDIKAVTADTYDVKKAELISELKQKDVEKLFYERSELVATLAYENDDSLLSVANALDVKVSQSAAFTRNSGQGVAINKAIRDAAFSKEVLTEGRNSEVIELNKNHIVVLRVNQHIKASPKKLEEVKASIEVTLKSDNAKLKSQEIALKLLADLQNGASYTDSAKAKNIKLTDLGKVKRDSPSVDQVIINEAFQMTAPVEGKNAYKSIDLKNSVAVLVLKSVIDTEALATKEEMKKIMTDVESSLSSQEMTAVIDFIKSQSNIVKNQNL